MNNDVYLNQVVQNHKQPNSYSSKETLVFREIARYIQNWFDGFKYCQRNGPYISLEIQQSGSRAKGTAIKGKSDIDIFLAFSDPYGYFQLKELYDSVFYELKKHFGTVRKQNVSIGLKYEGFDIDIVPARKVNSNEYSRLYDYYLWSNKRQNKMLTNIHEHISLVKNSGCISEIILAKVWREQKMIEFPSILLELFVIEALSRKCGQLNSFEERVDYMFHYFRDNIENKRIVDPGNSSNILSDELNSAEKRAIKIAAQKAIDATSWLDVVK